MYPGPFLQTKKAGIESNFLMAIKSVGAKMRLNLNLTMYFCDIIHFVEWLSLNTLTSVALSYMRNWMYRYRKGHMNFNITVIEDYPAMESRRNSLE